MGTSDRGDWLAWHVAQAAEAWLTDSRDTEAYRRLVEATEAWRTYTHPMLEGTEHAGRRQLPLRALHPVQEPPGPPSSDTEHGTSRGAGKEPHRLGEIVADPDPRAVLSRLTGRDLRAPQDDAAGTRAQ